MFLIQGSLLAEAKKNSVRLSEIKMPEKFNSIVMQMSHLELLLGNIKSVNKNLLKLEKRLESNEIIGLELLIADTTNAQFESRFGHALFRFVDKNRKASNDMVVGYVAQIDTPGLNYLKGLFGGYALVPEIRPLREFHQQYAGEQERFLDRYLISSDHQLRSSLLKQLALQWRAYTSAFSANLNKRTKKAQKKAWRIAEREKAIIQEILGFNGEKIGYRIMKGTETIKVIPISFKLGRFSVPKNYTFLQNNCSGAIVDLLRQSGLKFLPKFSVNAIVPVKLDNHLVKHNLIHFKLTKIPIVSSKLSSLIKLSDKSLMELKKMNIRESSAIIIENIHRFSPSEKFAILDNFKLTEEAFNLVLERISSENIPSYEEVYDIKNINEKLYEICLDGNCIDNSKELYLIPGKRKTRYPRSKITPFLKKLLISSKHLL